MAERHDHAPALQRLEKDGRRASRTASFARASRAVAARLAARGVVKGDRVVLSAQNHPDWAIAYFGILRAGAIAVPLDPALDDDGARERPRRQRARAVVVRLADARRGAPRRRRTFDIHAITAAPTTRSMPPVDRRRRRRRREPHLHERHDRQAQGRDAHARELHVARRRRSRRSSRSRGKDRVLSVLPLHHTFEFTCGLLLPLSRGARVVYLDELNGDRLAEGLQRGEGHRDGRRAGAVAAPRAAHPAARSRRAARWRRAALRRRRRAEPRLLGRTLGIDAGRVLFGAGARGARRAAAVAHLGRRRAPEGDAGALRRARPPARRGLRPHRGGAGAHRRAGRPRGESGERRQADPRRRAEDRQPGRPRASARSSRAGRT